MILPLWQDHQYQIRISCIQTSFVGEASRTNSSLLVFHLCVLVLVFVSFIVYSDDVVNPRVR
jgi:hypothetical protein